MCDILSAVLICEWNQYAEAKNRHNANRVVTGSSVKATSSGARCVHVYS